MEHITYIPLEAAFKTSAKVTVLAAVLYAALAPEQQPIIEEGYSDLAAWFDVLLGHGEADPIFGLMALDTLMDGVYAVAQDDGMSDDVRVMAFMVGMTMMDMSAVMMEWAE